MAHDTSDLAAAARQEMIGRGFSPNCPPEAERQLETTRLQPDGSLRDLTSPARVDGGGRHAGYARRFVSGHR